MALKFIGERTIGALNGMRDGFVKDDLYRVYDAGILMPGGVSVDHGDFVSWDGTKWKLETDIKIARSDEISNTNSSIAPSYTKKTYPANSYVMQGGVLYTNENAIETAEDWNPAHWTQTAVAASVEQTEQDMKDMEEMFLVNLPCAANTLRFEFSKMDYDPTVAGVGSSGTWKKVNAKFHNVWDFTKTGYASTFANAFKESDNFVSVIAANMTGVTNLFGTFQGCTSLTSVVLFDTSATTVMTSTFQGCTSLTSIPLFDTSAASNMNNMFNGCTKVEGGALALYQQVSTQATPPANHTDTFKNCGKDTTTGAAELAQIPSDWGGTAAG